MKAPSNRRFWTIGITACVGLLFELVVIAGLFNSPSASSLHRGAFWWNVVCAILALIALVLGATLNEKRLHTSIGLAFIACTGPLLVFVSMQPANPIYCFIQNYKSSPSATLGGFSLVFVPIVLMATFLTTLYQRFRSIRSPGVTV